MLVKVLVFISILILSWQTQAFTLSGEIQIKNECRDDLYHFWVSDGSTQLFSLDVTGNSTFTFNLSSGKYRLTIISKSGCYGYEDVSLNKDKFLKLTLKKEKRLPTNVGTIFPWGLNSNQCWSCAFRPISTPYYPVNTPWWNTYSQLSYTNSQMPTAWNRWGIDKSYFPSSGHVGFGKPQLYHNIRRENAWVQIKIDDEKIIGSIPKIQNDSKIKLLKNGRFQTEGKTYPYLFYDFSADESHLQLKDGFCGDRIEILNKMTKYLESLGFPENSTKDFSNYWQLKLPKANSYCAYPQEDQHLQNTAIITSNHNYKLVRCNFLVVLQQQCLDGKDLCNPSRIKISNKKVSPPFEGIFEWGIGYYFN